MADDALWVEGLFGSENKFASNTGGNLWTVFQVQWHVTCTAQNQYNTAFYNTNQNTETQKLHWIHARSHINGAVQ